jgi:hypothetical protein
LIFTLTLTVFVDGDLPPPIILPPAVETLACQWSVPYKPPTQQITAGDIAPGGFGQV